MKEAQGGTQMYCPHCKEESICAAVATTKCGLPSGQRWSLTEHADVNWFRRGRHCLICGKLFVTAEVEEQFLYELVSLRAALADIKRNAEHFANQSLSASLSLAKLSASLDVLKALRSNSIVYQNEIRLDEWGVPLAPSDDK